MELVDDVTVRIVIKQGIEFHNGELLTAPGLAKSFELLRDADPQKFTWSFRQLNDYESYEVIDDYTMGVHADRTDRSLGQPVCQPHAVGARPPRSRRS